MPSIPSSSNKILKTSFEAYYVNRDQSLQTKSKPLYSIDKLGI